MQINFQISLEPNLLTLLTTFFNKISTDMLAELATIQQQNVTILSILGGEDHSTAVQKLADQLKSDDKLLTDTVNQTDK